MSFIDDDDLLDEMMSFQKQGDLELNDMAIDIMREFDGGEEWDDGCFLLSEGSIYR